MADMKLRPLGHGLLSVLFLVTPTLEVGCGGGATSAESPANPGTAQPATGAIKAALAGEARTEAERQRDQYRHPQETLELFGIRPEMNVVELAPGGGWYTAILAPLLAAHGHLRVTSADPNGPPDSESTKYARALLARFAADPAVFGRVEPVVVDWKKPSALGPDGAADMVLTFRSLHGWVHAGNLDAVLAGVLRALKPGGVFGVVEHRANAGASTDAKVIGDTGYVPEAYVIARVTVAGFKLVARSEVNANPRDTKDYPKGVWTLPPTFELGDVDHARYAAIGESDRMTLKFVKP
jgi:predicted methyltransferase